MKLSILSAFLLLLYAQSGCNQSTKDPFRDWANKPQPAPTKQPQDGVRSVTIDIPRLAGKSQQEVKKVLGKPVAVDKLNPTDTTGEISYDYKFDNASAFINFKNGKANYFHFYSKNEYETVFELADLVGANLRGVVPVSSNPAQITYSGNIGGYTFEEVRALVDGRYSIITFRVQ